MTRDQWRRLEPLLTRVASLTPEEQERALSDVRLEAEFRRHVLRVLRESREISSRLVTPVASGAANPSSNLTRPEGGETPPPVHDLPPLLAANDTVDAGRYRIIHQLGRGGMGEVYQAFDSTLEKLVALKVLRSGRTREAQHAARCSGHPHIVTVHNVFETAIKDWLVTVLVMEYVSGKPASRMIDDGEVTVDDAVKWTRQVASALAHAHDCDVLHCDLKPANIIITPKGDAVVIDFGIGRAAFEPVGASRFGTVPYMAPEQLLTGECSRASDIYSLGVTLFELLTHRLPFAGTGDDLVLRIVGAPAPRPSEFTGDAASLDDVIARALAKKPGDRFPSARAFERALSDAVGPRRVPAPRPPWEWVGLAAAVATIGLAGVVLLGALTSSLYNIILERGDFADETVWDWLTWGRRTSIPPLIILLLTMAAVAPLVVVRRVLVSMFSRLRELDGRVSASLTALARRVHLDEAQVLMSYALLGSGLVLVATVVYFWPLILALLGFVSRTSPERLALLSSANVSYHNAYRWAFTFVVLSWGVMWFPAIQAARRGEALSRTGWVLGGAILLAALMLLHFPYRLMNYRTTFAVVSWKGAECYVTGERPDAVLLFCPDGPDGRVQRVTKGDENLRDLRRTETDLFRRFSSGGATPRRSAS